jgi:hypothetical protein
MASNCKWQDGYEQKVGKDTEGKGHDLCYKTLPKHFVGRLRKLYEIIRMEDFRP